MMSNRTTRINGIGDNYGGNKSWHQLTQAQIDGLKLTPDYEGKSIQELLDKNGLGFGVRSEEMVIANPWTGELKPTGCYGVYTNDDAFRQLGKGFGPEYVPLSYVEILEKAFGDLTELGQIPCRVLRINEGARAAIQFLAPDSFYAADLEHRMFLNLYAGHDGLWGIMINGSDVTMVCLNTIAKSRGSKVLRHTAKHTKNVNNKLAEINLAITAQSDAQKEFMEFLNSAAMVQAASEEVTEFVNFMFPDTQKEGIRKNAAISNQREELVYAIETSRNERNVGSISFHELMQGVTRQVTYKTQKRTADEQFEYVLANDKPQIAKAYIAEKIGYTLPR